jgi:hypothetical protein
MKTFPQMKVGARVEITDTEALAILLECFGIGKV